MLDMKCHHLTSEKFSASVVSEPDSEANILCITYVYDIVNCMLNYFIRFVVKEIVLGTRIKINTNVIKTRFGYLFALSHVG